MSLLLQHAWQVLLNMGKILHRLWLEITGAVFLGMAAFGSLSVWKEWRSYQAGGELWKLVAALTFVIMMGAFGVHSFFRARRLR
jgi:hypothetical protein